MNVPNAPAVTRIAKQGCYQEGGEGAWVVIAPEYRATAAAPPVAVAPPPPPARVVRDELRDRMLQLREGCEDGDRRACVAKIGSAARLGGVKLSASTTDCQDSRRPHAPTSGRYRDRP